MGKEIDALDGWKEFAQKSPIAVTFLNPYFLGSFSTLLNPTFASQMYAFTCASVSVQCVPSDADWTVDGRGRLTPGCFAAQEWTLPASL